MFDDKTQKRLKSFSKSQRKVVLNGLLKTSKELVKLHTESAKTYNKIVKACEIEIKESKHTNNI